ncbi:thermonuclease family protein [Ruegeria arenilitoris]|uniref:thermonuclease family protein n=1 Tax=Ruegeria arenilitoris TaxID=1173585 RepID=UPI00147B750D|nr:hypothetical protein [Ruegeria arenilitoris]
MPFTPEKLDEIQRCINLALASTLLNEWERDFLRGIKSKLDRHGTGTNLTKKQYSQLLKITTKQTRMKSRSVRQPNSPARLKTSRRAFAKNRRRHKAKGNKLLSLIIALGVAIFLVFQAVERFPEYLGTVVALTSTQELRGRVTRVRDGDTIEVAGVPIRFGSLDCSERGTTKGRQATGRMQTLVTDQNLTCYLNGRTSYDRKIGSCRLEDGRDLGGIMISEGVCRRFW